jgi:hypothetical protein
MTEVAMPKIRSMLAYLLPPLFYDWRCCAEVGFEKHGSTTIREILLHSNASMLLRQHREITKSPQQLEVDRLFAWCRDVVVIAEICRTKNADASWRWREKALVAPDRPVGVRSSLTIRFGKR